MSAAASGGGGGAGGGSGAAAPTAGGGDGGDGSVAAALARMDEIRSERDELEMAARRKLMLDVVPLEKELSSLQARVDAATRDLPVAPHLQFYYGGRCPYTAKVAPQVACLELHLGQRLSRFETWESEANHRQWVAVGGQENCGGVPFFFNRETGESICGATSCDLLKNWAAASASTPAVK